MRVILDACLPHRLGRALARRDVQSVHDLGCSNFDDGPLLAALSVVVFGSVSTISDIAALREGSLH